ncbi:hypothetical protein MASR1M48_17030 [Lactococcus petauri]
MNRKERRAKESLFKKQIKEIVKTNDWGEWKDMSAQAREKFDKEFIVGFYANDIYSVQVYNENGQILIGIRRHDQSSNIPWSHKQRIKNELFGEERLFVECFPPQSKLVDQANLYWLWEMMSDESVFNLNQTIKRRGKI